MPSNYSVSTRIMKPVSDVFAAVVSRQQLTRYFTDACDRDLEAGSRVTWTWKDWGEFPVTVERIEPDVRIELVLNSTEWKKTEGHGYDVRIVFDFESLDDGSTLLTVSEEGWRDDPQGLKASHDNCGGWMHMITCLKAWLEHGIDLR